MFRPPGDASQAARILGKKMYVSHPCEGRSRRPYNGSGIVRLDNVHLMRTILDAISAKTKPLCQRTGSKLWAQHWSVSMVNINLIRDLLLVSESSCLQQAFMSSDRRCGLLIPALSHPGEWRSCHPLQQLRDPRA